MKWAEVGSFAAASFRRLKKQAEIYRDTLLAHHRQRLSLIHTEELTSGVYW